MRKKRQSKFVGKTFDNGWTCTGINVASCTLRHKNGGPNYWYAFERRTSDGKLDKWIRVEGSDATKIYKGKITVESLCEAIETGKDKKQKHSVNYNF